MSGAIPLLHVYVFVACIGVTLTKTLIKVSLQGMNWVKKKKFTVFEWTFRFLVTLLLPEYMVSPKGQQFYFYIYSYLPIPAFILDLVKGKCFGDTGASLKKQLVYSRYKPQTLGKGICGGSCVRLFNLWLMFSGPFMIFRCLFNVYGTNKHY
jgi:hypothetical protein